MVLLCVLIFTAANIVSMYYKYLFKIFEGIGIEKNEKVIVPFNSLPDKDLLAVETVNDLLIQNCLALAEFYQKSD
jgi:hypothetical protein